MGDLEHTSDPLYHQIHYGVSGQSTTTLVCSVHKGIVSQVSATL